MHSHTVTVRRLAKLVGKLTATVLAVVPGPLLCRELQMLRTKGLLKSQQNYEDRVTLTPDVVGKIARAPQWPIFNPDLPGPSDHNRHVEDRLGSSGGGSENTGCMVGRRVTTTHQRPRTESREVCCDGIHETQIPQPCLPTHGQCNGSSLCEQEGGTRSSLVLQETKEIWQYCLARKITLTAEHLPGRLNMEADFQSRYLQDNSCWKLDPQLFKMLNQQWGQLHIDLFADRLTTQLPKTRGRWY